MIYTFPPQHLRERPPWNALPATNPSLPGLCSPSHWVIFLSQFHSHWICLPWNHFAIYLELSSQCNLLVSLFSHVGEYPVGGWVLPTQILIWMEVCAPEARCLDRVFRITKTSQRLQLFPFFQPSLHTIRVDELRGPRGQLCPAAASRTFWFWLHLHRLGRLHTSQICPRDSLRPGHLAPLSTLQVTSPVVQKNQLRRTFCTVGDMFEKTVLWLEYAMGFESLGEDTSTNRWACTSPQEAASVGWGPRMAMPVIVAMAWGLEKPSPMAITTAKMTVNRRRFFIRFLSPQFVSWNYKSKGWSFFIPVYTNMVITIKSFISSSSGGTLQVESTDHPGEIWAENREWWIAPPPNLRLYYSNFKTRFSPRSIRTRKGTFRSI